MMSHLQDGSHVVSPPLAAVYKATSAGCPLARRVRVTSLARCMRYCSSSIVHSWLLEFIVSPYRHADFVNVFNVLCIRNHNLLLCLGVSLKFLGEFLAPNPIPLSHGLAMLICPVCCYLAMQ